MKITVLGYGRVGRAIVDDLVKQGHEVTVVDKSEEVRLLKKAEGCPFRISTIDVKSLYEMTKCVKDQDLVVNALPGSIGYEITKSLLYTKKNVVDISFFPEDPEPLRKMAEKAGVICAIDCGLAPGVWNMILGYEETISDTVSCKCYVGGLPKELNPPFNYKAPYHPYDVIEMYTRESRYLERGKVVAKPALTDLELLMIDGVSLEAFNTDGLRTLLKGMSTPSIVEKTLRYPGTAQMMTTFRDMGFFSEKENDRGCTPVNLFAELVFPKWEFKAGEKDITLMLIIVDCADGTRKTYKLYDESNGEFSSMARTTGYVATAVVDLLAREIIQEPGLYAPEDIGKVACMNVIHYLQDRGIFFKTR